MPTEPNKQYAYFTVVGEFDPEDISRQVGMRPSDCWMKGDIHPRTRLERKFSRWSLDSRLDRSVPLEAHIKDVLDQLDQRRDAFIQLTSCQDYCAMELVGLWNTGYPGLHIDFDFYYVYSDRREDT